MQDILIEAGGLSFYINRRKILENLSFRAKKGHIYGLFGPNGSGKTTLFNLLCGLYKPNSGWITFYGERIKKVDPLHVSKFKGGLARTFQIPVVIDGLSVVDNLLLAFRFQRESFSSLIYQGKKDKKMEAAARLTACSYLNRFDLKSKADILAGTLSYGERRLISNLCTALTGSKILLLDEPFANLNSRNIESLKRLLRTSVDEEQRTIILIEHVPDNLLNFADVLLHLHEHRLDAYDVKAKSPEDLTKIIHSSVFQYE
jgi:branched-chain amino acid transport system ATP-binding protein